jgi:peroxiredoxin
VLGISPDPVEAIAKFAGKHRARIHPARHVIEKASPKTHDDVVLEALSALA